MKIDWPGYLTPHPVLCIGNLKNSKSGSNKSLNIFICNSSIEYLHYFIDLSNILHGMSRIQGGGGEASPAGYLTPHPVLCLENLKTSKSGSNKRSNIFICNSSIEYCFILSI